MGETAMPMLAGLLDRSITRIGELAADSRYLDRREVARTADVWDNNTTPLFRAAVTRPGWLRERRARTALRWMAGLGRSRREWMIETGGPAVGSLLGEAPDEPAHYRDYRGLVRPTLTPLGEIDLARDYDLELGQVEAFRVEQAGRSLSGFAELSAPRRYAAPESTQPPSLHLYLEDVDLVRFDSDDRSGTVLAGPDIRFGTGGRLRGRTATVYIEDSTWHLSPSGQAADAVTPRKRPRGPRPLTRPSNLGAAGNAAFTLYRAMIAIRRVRHPHAVSRVPLGELCHALTGAGTDVLSAAAERDREAAFTSLAEKWISRSPYLAAVLDDRRPQETPAVTGLGRLILVSYRSSALITMAVPSDDGIWRLRTEEFPAPARLAVEMSPGGALTLR